MLALAKKLVSMSGKTMGRKQNLGAMKMGTFNAVPEQYAKPYRKTAYIMSQPAVVNQGLLYKQQGLNYGGIININNSQPQWLTSLFGDNEVSMTPDRLVDARSLTWFNPVRAGWEPS